MGLIPLTPWATAYRYPADDPAAEPPLPTSAEIDDKFKLIVEFMDEVMKEARALQTKP
jgi:hypothetical protein